VVPHLPQTREGERLLAPEADSIRLLGRALPGRLLPLVKGVGGDEAAPLLHRAAEGGLLQHALAARVDHAIADGLILRPRWHQPPAELLELAAAGRLPVTHHRRHI